MATPAKLIEVKNLSIGYDVPVVVGLDFDLYAGDFLCVVGANGTGKSTLIKTLLGLMPPLAGEVKYTQALPQNFIGYIPQDSKLEPNFPASVYEIVLSGTLNRLGYRPFYSAAEKQVAEQNLELLGLMSLKSAAFCDLSGGQRQKVLLARSLCATQKLLILDEPSNNLDHDSRREFYDLLRRLNLEQGLSIILITHDLDSASLMGNKLLSLSVLKPEVVPIEAGRVGGVELKKKI